MDGLIIIRMYDILVRTSLCGGHNLPLLIGTVSTIQPVVIMDHLLESCFLAAPLLSNMILLKGPKVAQLPLPIYFYICNHIIVLSLTIKEINYYYYQCIYTPVLII